MQRESRIKGIILAEQLPTDGESKKYQTEDDTGVAQDWEDPHDGKERPSGRRHGVEWW